jgi:hypothetical protein
MLRSFLSWRAVLGLSVFVAAASAFLLGLWIGSRRTSAPPQLTIDQKVAAFKVPGVREFMSSREFWDKVHVYDLPDKREALTPAQANKEFRPAAPFQEFHGPNVERFFPFETVGGPAYRVNLLWCYSVNDKESFLGGIYFRSPN